MEWAFYFSNSSDVTGREGVSCVYLFRGSRWDDFGEKPVLGIKIFNGLKLVLEDEEFTKIAFKNFEQEEEVFGGGLKSINNADLLFFTQAISKSYKNVLNEFGIKRSIFIFRKLRDLGVINKLAQKEHRSLQRSIETKLYESLLRESSSYLLYKGSSLAFEISEKEFLPVLDISFKLKSFKNYHETRITFEDTPLGRNRAAILVGKNGVGKSQTLRHICFQEIQKILDLKNALSGKVFNRVIALTSVQEDKDSLPKIEELQTDGEMFYKYINLYSKKEDNTLADSIIVLIRNDKEKIERLKKLLNEIIAFDDILLPLKEQINSFKVIVHKNAAHLSVNDFFTMGEQKRLNATAGVSFENAPVLLKDGIEVKLSTGQEMFLNLACRLLGYTSPNSLLLIEEPETYLHPNFEIDFLKIVFSLLQECNSYCVISTHSIFITREVQRSQVKVLNINEGKINFSTPSFQTYGASLDTISSYVFGDIDKDKIFESTLDKLGTKDIGKLSSFLGDDAKFYLSNKL